MKDLVIYGCGSVGRMVEQIIYDLNVRQPQWNILGFLDDDPATHGTRVADYPVLGDHAALSRYPEAMLAVALSQPYRKRELIQRLSQYPMRRYATLIHPLAWIARRVALGTGSIVYPGVHIDVDVHIGDFVLINKVCTIGHDTVVGNYTTMAPGVKLGGQCRFEEGVDFGINASTVQGRSIGAWSIIGAGAVVLRDIPPASVAVGVPAKVIKPAPEAR